MSPKRGDDVAPPTVSDEWKIRYAKTEAIKGWQKLTNTAGNNLRTAWDILRTRPGQGVSNRHHQLKGGLATGSVQAKDDLPRWQIEVTGAGRVWYLIDAEARTVWLEAASVGHPKLTEG
ncbi:hypothetical protein BAY61_20595 [Prauserella marina]|uniref:Uncharacterized protein n=1 Tax=Prauserella marina TaxID=530584 RepID=A0A222VT15_9PSEU|nr:hypothetical protein [Prauserella marina]ASR36982.1 hypothetical protein BAY61_20595 [Prauserella marina]PWV80050.1 hypothetical protein DES30_103136 [Prauserella marina]SDD84317.1 hypothetical protein SAMN05421630_11381 [Prauserella marina]